jgi:hypothetical protein
MNCHPSIRTIEFSHGTGPGRPEKPTQSADSTKEDNDETIKLSITSTIEFGAMRTDLATKGLRVSECCFVLATFTRSDNVGQYALSCSVQHR